MAAVRIVVMAALCTALALGSLSSCTAQVIIGWTEVLHRAS